MQSRLSSTTTFGAVQLPHHLPSVYDAAIRSLIAERELFAIVAPLLSEIGKAEAEPIGMLPDMPALIASWASVIDTLQSWRMQREAPRGKFSTCPYDSAADISKPWCCLTATLSLSRSLYAFRVSPLIFRHPLTRISDTATEHIPASR